MGLKIASLSDSAASAPTQRLSLCMIVRDEEEALPRCLRSVEGVVDEIIIVDTGSTDRTVEIAESFGATVIHEAWTGDFGHHRNTSLNAATGDWVLVLDADEELVDGRALRPLLGDPDVEGYCLREVNFIGQEAGHDAVVNSAFRVFRNRPGYRYEGALHEQILVKIDPNNEGRSRFVGIEILHYGYLDQTSEAREKKARNMRIVLEEVKRKPNDAFTLFNAGVEFQRIDDHTTALEYFVKAFRNLKSMRQYFASLLVRNLALSLKELERYDEALDVVADALDAYPDFADLHYLQGQLHFARREYRESIASFQRAVDIGDHAGDRYMAQAGMGSFYSLFALGTLHEALGDQPEAVRCYKRSVTTARGFYAPPLVRLAQMLVRTDPVEDVERLLMGLLPNVKRAEALRAIGDVFITEGHPEAARRLLEQSLQLDPDTHSIRVSMAHCLLYNGDADGALALLDQVPDTSESAASAHAKRVLVGVAEQRLDVADDSIRRVRAIMEGPYEEAWTLVVQAQRGNLPESVVGDADMLTAITFDVATALMELNRLDAFNALVPLLYRIAPDPLQLDERLGHLFLDHGFEDPAADRLLSAAQGDGVRPETLSALGGICARRDMPEDAEVFYRAALEMDDQSLSRYLELAGHLAGAGRYGDASDVLQAGLAVWPHSTVLRELRHSMGLLAESRSA